ncbi:hypothetical protein [Haloechinothrix salitolerans]|uniref:Membrane-bound lytic murein transglycosylase B n=1 Tax=Haloechinothrix salitolerans TaxID=926830 RepID=A0ABW2BVB8_9PSEU
MAGHALRPLRQIVRTLRHGLRRVDVVPALDVGRGLHLSLAALLLATNTGYAVPTMVTASSGPETTRQAPFGVDGGTAAFLQPPPVPSTRETVVRVSAKPRSHQPTAAPAFDPLGIPRSALRAYRDAEKQSNTSDPRCGLTAALLAAIGRVESGHAQGGNVDENGTTLRPILGPRLDGSPGVAAIRDTDGGRYDADTTWDRAVGPMQFIPSTWAGWAADGNADGVASPHNLYDSTVAAAGYLCAGDRDLRRTGDLHAAILSYNHSTRYLSVVLAWLEVYSGETVVIPDARHGGTAMASSASREQTTRRDSRPAASQPQRGQHGSDQPSAPVQEASPTGAPAPPTRPAKPGEPSPDKPGPGNPGEPDPVKAVRDTADTLTDEVSGQTTSDSFDVR